MKKFALIGGGIALAAIIVAGAFVARYGGVLEFTDGKPEN